MSRILFIDAYDSFSNNIIALLKDQLQASVYDIKIDDARFVLNDDAFFDFLRGFDAVVTGPGPGHPANVQDTGLTNKLWTLSDVHLLPVLGICLGFQSLALFGGASIERLPEPRHGRIATIDHCNSDLFYGVGTAMVTQYHSLHAVSDYKPSSPFEPSGRCPDVIPLAWDHSAGKPVLMGLKHRTKPFHGIQFHPESVCTNPAGASVICNWWRSVTDWYACKAHVPLSTDPSLTLSSSASSVSELCTPEDDDAPCAAKTGDQSLNHRVTWKTAPIALGFSLADLFSRISQHETSPPVLLESGTRNDRAVNVETGRFSILGIRAADALEVQYFSNNHRLIVSRHNSIENAIPARMSQVFTELDDLVTRHRASDGPDDVPFWGGFVGYLSYEAGLETIDVAPTEKTPAKPDVWFVMIDRSIVIDHVEEVAFIQTLRPNDDTWVQSVASNLAAPSKVKPVLKANRVSSLQSEPKQQQYCADVETCQAHLRAGSSYELCLTGETTLYNSLEPWDLYIRLREANPAPFGAFLDLRRDENASLSLVGSSPERFLSWNREGKCQFRPIKGTVKKTSSMTRERAEEILRSEKERAENLMIVDLIRHDLNGVPGVRDVRVPKLMSVEEYETVYQLVSVVEGDVTPPTRGIAALARSLPPGSMTGAPKKRSCELLSKIEGRSRGLYSGVLGYLDVGGGGDFSVVIRSAFKWSDDDEWRIGAGGAITALSEPEAEWEEMLTKRERLLSVFN